MSANRSMRRQILRQNRMSAKDFNQKVEDVQDHVMSASISMSINILHDKYGWSYEQLCEMANAIVDEYEKIEDFDAYAAYVLNKTGVGVMRTQEVEGNA